MSVRISYYKCSRTKANRLIPLLRSSLTALLPIFSSTTHPSEIYVDLKPKKTLNQHHACHGAFFFYCNSNLRFFFFFGTSTLNLMFYFLPTSINAFLARWTNIRGLLIDCVVLRLSTKSEARARATLDLS